MLLARRHFPRLHTAALPAGSISPRAHYAFRHDHASPWVPSSQAGAGRVSCSSAKVPAGGALPPRPASRETGGQRDGAGGGGTISSRELTRQIQAAPHWRRLERLFIKHRDRLDHIHLGALFVQLAGTTAAGERVASDDSARLAALLDALLQHAIEPSMLRRLGPRQVANTLWALSRLQHRPGEPTALDALLRQAAAQYQRVAPQELATLLLATAKLGHRPPDAWLSATLKACHLSLDRFNAQDLACTLHALALMQQSTATGTAAQLQPLAQQLLRESGRHMQAQSPQGLCMLLRSCVALRLAPPAPWLSACILETYVRLDACNAQELATIIWAFARLGVDPGRGWRQRWLAHTQQRLGSFSAQDLCAAAVGLAHLRAPPEEAWQQAFLAAAAAQQQRGGFSPRGLANLLWAAAVLRMRVPPAWMQQALQATLPLLPSFAPMDLAQLAYALGRLQQQQLGGKWLARFLAVAHSKLPDFNAQDLANTLFGLAIADAAPPTPWLDWVCMEAAGKLSSFKPGELTMALWSLARLGHRPSRLFMSHFCAQAGRRLGELRPQELALLLHAVAKLGYVPSAPWLEAVSAQLRTQLGEFTAVEVVMVTKALARLGHRRGSPLLSCQPGLLAAGTRSAPSRARGSWTAGSMNTGAAAALGAIGSSDSASALDFLTEAYGFASLCALIPSGQQVLHVDAGWPRLLTAAAARHLRQQM